MTERAGQPLTHAEIVAVGTVVAGMIGLGTYGFATGAKSTVGYLVTITILVGVIGLVRRDPLPDALAVALGVEGVAHLAGGLVNVGTDVLYNASLGTKVDALDTHILQYDHFVHSFGTFLATVTLWTLLVAPWFTGVARRQLLTLCVLGGLGIGALNEMIEFISTRLHRGAGVGGYTNTGWDLVSNTIGATVALLVLRRASTRSAPAPPV